MQNDLFCMPIFIIFMRVCFKNFTGGEISDTLLARYDLAKYQNSLLRMENFFPNTHSNAVRRSGMRFVAVLGESTEENKNPVKAVLMPFIFSTEEEQNYVIVFFDKKFSVYNKAGIVAENIACPYAENDLYALSYAQVADTIYIAHKNYPLQKLTRSGEAPYTWAVNDVSINSSIAAPNKPTVTWKSGSGSGAAPADYQLRYKVVSVDSDGVQSVPSEAGAVTGRYPTEWIVGDKVTISWNAVNGAEEYNIYRESAGYFGYIGTTESTSFVDNNYEPDTRRRKTGFRLLTEIIRALFPFTSKEWCLQARRTARKVCICPEQVILKTLGSQDLCRTMTP